MASPTPQQGIELYESEDGRIRVECRLESGSLWLTQKTIADLFEKDLRTINEHLQNVFREGELSSEATIRKFRIVRLEGSRQITRALEHYNLDAILSVGYRVNSKRGTQFRIWATQTLRDHLLRGYTLHEPRLREAGLRELEDAIALLSKTLRSNKLVSKEGVALLDIVERYTATWRMLPAYDAATLLYEPDQPKAPTSPLPVRDARHAIQELRCASADRGEAIELFGREHGDQLAGILGAIEQTFSGAPLYPSAQERAAHLLYFIIKDHPFVDGNKRIGALLFLEYLRRNDLLLEDGALRLDANAVVALTLLIAESEPSQKNLMTRLILGMLNGEPLNAGATRHGHRARAAVAGSVPARVLSA